jgi:hypothetical protein
MLADAQLRREDGGEYAKQFASVKLIAIDGVFDQIYGVK